MRAALQKQVEAGRAQTEQIMGKNSFLNSQIDQQKKAIEAVKLIGCKSDGDKAYLCDVEAGGNAGRVRMLKGSDGWIFDIQKAKNANSQRCIPLHRVVVESGFPRRAATIPTKQSPSRTRAKP
ncbi:hypothetical protein [Paraburkholderia antibiotica]|uniref:Uncharacterized protein n=1 Tax=Paraburkholderia antibiotica TaxID=2728839 RepID=A0A7X9X903_9BURK|nr:hypothetical protein [Paraburkholderia antibiotica]NML33573.1 hypothetical protein [Paraburkholderia antibiotica]